MYMDDIKLFEKKKWNKNRDFDEKNKNIHSRLRNGICKGKMCLGGNERLKKSNKGRNRDN